MGYVAGSKVQTTKRLKHIKTFVGTQPALDYRFTYSESQASERSRLETLQQCDAQQVCLPATQLDWLGQNAPSWISTPGFDSDNSNSGQWLPMAINGDGRADIVNIFERSGQDYFLSYLSTGNGTWASTPEFNAGYTYDGQWFSMDINGDTMSDLVKVSEYGSKAYFYAYLATGNGNWETAQTFSTPQTVSESEWVSGDINGDARIDLVNIYQYGSTNHFQAYLATGNADWAPVSFNTNNPIHDNEQWLPIDLNADGMIDLVNIFPYGGLEYLLSYISQGNGEWESSSQFNTNQSAGQWIPMDINGDARVDIVNVLSSSSKERFYAYLATGNGNWLSLPEFNTNKNTYGQWVPMDVNGDGMTDLVNIFDASDSHDHFLPYLSKGEGNWAVGSEFNTGNAVHRDDNWLPMDVNGVGIASIVNLFDSDSTRSKHFLTYPSTLTQASDLISTVTNGLNGSSTMEHAPLTDKY